MKRLKLLALTLFLVFLLLPLTACVSQTTYNQLQNLNSELQASNVSLQDQLQAANSEKTSLQSQNVALESQLQSLQTQMAAQEATLKSTQDQLKDARQQLETTDKLYSEAVRKVQLYRSTFGAEVYSEIPPPYKKTSSALMNPINNTAAVDPTWQQLVSFVLKDDTDSKPYFLDIFMCGGFSEMFHNNAEASGIRTAMVTIQFKNEGPGHALNAVKTTDRGLIYIDCTGQGLQQLTYQSSPEYTPGSWDKIAYLALNKEYGSLLFTGDVSSSYAYYEEQLATWTTFQQKLDAFDLEVAQFNQEISGKTYYIGTPQWRRIKEWEASLEAQALELEALRDSLVPCWKPLGVVSEIEIYW